MYLSPAKCFLAPLHHQLDHNTLGHQDTWKQCSMAETPARSNRIRKNFTPAVMNSTVQDHQLGTESRKAMSCDLSNINNSVLCLKRVTDTPAKVFARLKAKVQRLNSEGHTEESVAPVQLCRSDSSSTNMQQPVVDGDLFDGQDTYVLTLSPPKSISKNPENLQRAPYLVIEGHNPDLFHKPVVDSENMLIETFNFKPQQGNTKIKSSSRSRNQEPYILLEHMPHDSSVQPVSAKPLYLKKQLKSRGDHGVFGEMSVQEDAEVDHESSEDRLEELGSADWSQPQPQQSKKISKPGGFEALLQTLPNLMEDSLLQQSPRIAIPRKRITADVSKQQSSKTDKDLKGKTKVNEVHLRDWVLKLHNKELIVDGIRIDNKIPWHSSCITERVSSKIVRTASGRTYILVGKMSNLPSSSFPSWFMKKFIFGFPEMWKEYLHKFLAGDQGSGKNLQKNNSGPCEQQQQNKRPSKKQISKQLESKNLVTSVSSADSVQPHSAPVSRSGRLIKPPLEYWRGGRITVGPDMNVTVHEDYTSTSISLTPKATPAVLVKSLKLPKEKPVPKSPDIKESSDDDIVAPRRRVKYRKTDQNTSLENASQKKFQDKVFSSDFGSEKVAAKQQPSQEAHPDRMYLRRGRSYSRERNLTGSESEVSMFGAHHSSAKDGLFAVQAPEGKPKTQLQTNHLQIDSKTVSTQPQLQKDVDHIFSPPNLTKSRKNASKQKSKIIPLIASMAEKEDSTSLHKEIQVSNTKNKLKENVTEMDRSYMASDAKNKSPPSDQKREYKGNNSVPTLKRMQNKHFRVSKSRRNETSCQVDEHPEQSKKKLGPKPPVSSNSVKKQKSTVKRKTNIRNHKEQTYPVTEEDALETAWTEQELQKLDEAVNSLPKHKNGYWVNVSQVVGTHSAEECQKHYTECYQTYGQVKKKGKYKTKTVKTNKQGKKTAPITAKVGTLKRKKQMWEFLDHMPKDDHDDVFAGSPMQNKQIKLPVWSANGDELDFGHLQNPQTPSSSMSSSVETPQCLHITPGMLRSVNRDNNDKYIYHLQKGIRQDSCGRKGNLKLEKSLSVPSVRKTKKRCVAEDDDFVVWNMLSDKDGASGRGGEEEEEDNYFMDEY